MIHLNPAPCAVQQVARVLFGGTTNIGRVGELAESEKALDLNAEYVAIESM
jgi:hypothetical protein